MNTVLRALLAGVFAVTLLAGCNKSEDAIDNMKSEMAEAVDAAKEAADAVAEETKDAAAATKEAASEAKEEAVDAIQAAKDASATNAAK